MAFFNKLKSVFGFSGEEYEIEENELSQRDATVTPLAQRRQAASASAKPGEKVVTPGGSAEVAPCEIQTSELQKGNCPEAIFNKVVEIFNESLPPFLRECVDPEKQARYIHDALDDSMKSYLAQIDRDADSRMKVKLENGQSALRQEIETLREKTKKIEDTSAEWKEQKLSAERQKRALSERVHDLEKQVDSFNAEKEQYELENKSLVNKLRALSIQDSDMDALRSENETLRNEIKILKENAPKTIVPAVDQETLKQLDRLKDSVDDLAAQKETLMRERNILANDIVVLKKKCEISDVMLNDLNHKASSAKLALAEKENQYNELLSKYDALVAADAQKPDMELRMQEVLSTAQERQKEIDSLHENLESVHTELMRVNSELHNESAKVQQLTEELRIAKETISQSAENNSAEEISSRDAVIAHQQNELAQLRTELKEAREEVEESRSSLAAFEESLIKIDEINESRQKRIAELQQQLKEKESELEATSGQLSEQAKLIEAKDEEISSLKATVDNNIQLQAASEALLREEIERLRKSPESTPRAKRKKTAQISSIDESLDDTNWLVSTPPEGINARPGGVSDSEFGYQAPQHRDEPNNPAQMLLW
ncbi:MAG: hypothetical protein BHV67_13130 [Bacteroidales bacterium 43_36]|nr:MAG: hypothetical protein BHV67_13130 [Bacteroidales bacterium 43_36]